MAVMQRPTRKAQRNLQRVGKRFVTDAAMFGGGAALGMWEADDMVKEVQLAQQMALKQAEKRGGAKRRCGRSC